MSDKKFTVSVLDPIVTQDVLKNTSINSTESEFATPQHTPNEVMLILIFLVIFGFGGILAIGCYYLFKESLGIKQAALVAAAVGLFSAIVILFIMFVLWV
jgi:uncharacterized membrane protein